MMSPESPESAAMQATVGRRLVYNRPRILPAQVCPFRTRFSHFSQEF